MSRPCRFPPAVASGKIAGQRAVVRGAGHCESRAPIHRRVKVIRSRLLLESWLTKSDGFHGLELGKAVCKRGRLLSSGIVSRAFQTGLEFCPVCRQSWSGSIFTRVPQK